MVKTITWKIGGEAGFGIMSSGTMLARTFSRAGFWVFATNEYPSLIRGGHNLVTVRLATEKFEAMDSNVHLLVALNQQTVELHKSELNDSSVVVFDPHDHKWQQNDFPAKVIMVELPLTEIVKKFGGEPVMRNTVALGATVALLGAEFRLLEAVIRDQFKRKGEAVVGNNTTIAQAGYEHIKKHYSSQSSLFLSPPVQQEPLMVLNASEAVGVGAVRAGLKFAAIYPMTPINALITFLADHEQQLNLVYMQPEDEIAGINMALGASVVGVRSMVATSGGGFALMVEGLALSGMIEAPLVIDLGMRVGPATGMPTWTEQGELLFVIHAGHGEFPRIVLAPGDADEAYHLTIEAFNLADRYQIPVFLLTDKYLNESQWCVPVARFKGEVTVDRGKIVPPQSLSADSSFKRYRLDVADGVSPRSFPGMKHGFYQANSYEHDEFGYVTEDAGTRTKMAARRLQKFAAISGDIKPPQVYGNADAQISLVSWGSNKGPLLEAIKLLDTKGIKAKLLHYTWLYPFPTEATQKLIGSSRVIVVEQNATGQLASLIKTHTGIAVAEKILKFDGRPFYPEEIVQRVVKQL